MSKANMVLNIFSGSVILQVALSGEGIDGARLAKQLEDDITLGRLSSVAVGCTPPDTNFVCWLVCMVQ